MKLGVKLVPVRFLFFSCLPLSLSGLIQIWFGGVTNWVLVVGKSSSTSFEVSHCVSEKPNQISLSEHTLEENYMYKQWS